MRSSGCSSVNHDFSACKNGRVIRSHAQDRFPQKQLPVVEKTIHVGILGRGPFIYCAFAQVFASPTNLTATSVKKTRSGLPSIPLPGWFREKRRGPALL